MVEGAVVVTGDLVGTGLSGDLVGVNQFMKLRSPPGAKSLEARSLSAQSSASTEVNISEKLRIPPQKQALSSARLS